MIKDCLVFYSTMRKKQWRGWINGIPSSYSFMTLQAWGWEVAFLYIRIRTRYNFWHDLSSTFVSSVAFRSGTSGLVVHCKTLLGTSTFNSSTLFFFWLLHLRILGDITSCSRPWTHLHQSKFKRKRLAQNTSNSNVCTPFL